MSQLKKGSGSAHGESRKRVKFSEADDMKHARDGAREPVDIEQARENRRAAREARKKRKLARPGAEVLESVRSIWEDCRRVSLKAEERKEPLDRLFTALRTHFAEALIKNDGSRVVQTLVKYGTKDQREEVVRELNGHFVELAKNPYGKHIIEKLLQSAPNCRSMIVSEFKGKLLACMKHKHASSVVETIYSDYCKVAQRNDMVHEFYGREYVLFAKDHAGLGIEDIIAKGPDKRVNIAKRLRGAIDSILTKEATNLVHHSIVHRLIYDYVKIEDPQKLRSWIPTIMDALVEIVHTLDGSKSVVLLMAIASAKERKAFVKACRPYLQKMMSDESAHVVVIALMSFVDDTVLIEKTFVTELLKDTTAALSNKFTRNILMFLYGGVTTRHFPKEVVNMFELAGRLSQETSKKPSELRQAELCSMVTPSLQSALSPRLKETIQGSSKSGPLMLEMMVSGHASELFDKVLQLSKEGIGLLAEEPYRLFLKRLMRRCSLSQLEKIIECLQPLEQLFATEAAFVLLGALERDESIRRTITMSITRLSEMTDSARAVADLINKVNAGIAIHEQQ